MKNVLHLQREFIQQTTGYATTAWCGPQLASSILSKNQPNRATAGL
jgi:hypothetical protein